MTTSIAVDPVPLRVDEHGAIRVGTSRVTLDVIVAEHRRGASPERIAEEYDTLELADVYAVIAYFLRHGDEVKTYLERREREAVAIRTTLERAGMSSPELAQAIQQRWTQAGNPHASSPE